MDQQDSILNIKELFRFKSNNRKIFETLTCEGNKLVPFVSLGKLKEDAFGKKRFRIFPLTKELVDDLPFEPIEIHKVRIESNIQYFICSKSVGKDYCSVCEKSWLNLTDTLFRGENSSKTLINEIVESRKMRIFYVYDLNDDVDPVKVLMINQPTYHWLAPTIMSMDNLSCIIDIRCEFSGSILSRNNLHLEEKVYLPETVVSQYRSVMGINNYCEFLSRNVKAEIIKSVLGSLI